MAKILLIETATEVCSAAIAADGRVIAIAEDLQQPNHTARLTLLIEDCVKQSGIALASLDAVAVSRGPGSYTSLRTGASVAKGLCYALDKPLIAVDTLQALAWAESRIADYGLRIADYGLGINPAPGMDNKQENEVLTTGRANPKSTIYVPMLDARRQEVWTAVYDADLQELLSARPLILQNNLFQKFIQSALEKSPKSRVVILGNGAKKLGNELIGENMVVSNIQNCSAGHLAGLAERFFQTAEFQDISYYEPHYMKPPNITTPGKPLF